MMQRPYEDDGTTNEDGALDTPLHRLPGFGAGLHRQRVAFVKAGEAPKAEAANQVGAVQGSAVSDLYLSIVMGSSKMGADRQATDRPQSAPPSQPTSLTSSLSFSSFSSSFSSSPPPVCDVCRLPMAASSSASHHETCLVHQVALGHSKPPSALDRSRFGLAIMSAQGWDPDSGRGLGLDQQGVPYPIEARLRPERQALGVQKASAYPSSSKSAASSTSTTPRSRQQTRKQLRKAEEDRRRRHDRLRDQIMGNRDLDKYLRPQSDEL